MSDDDLPLYVPVVRVDTLVRCNRCGAVVEGDVVGQTQHNVYHDRLDKTHTLAGRLTVYGGSPRVSSEPVL